MQRRSSPLFHRTAAAALCASLVLAISGAVLAQRGGGFGGFGGGGFGRLPEGPGVPIRSPRRGFEDGRLAHCKLQYNSVRREAMGVGWGTDYPYAGIHLLTRLGEMTKTAISRQSDGTPNYWVVKLTDPELFECPFLAASDVGTIGFSDVEAAHLRDYLLKGGFFWVDDFWGSLAWEQWSSEMAKVLPPSEYPIIDVPIEHPVFHSMFEITQFGERLTGGPDGTRGTTGSVPQVTNINNWRRFGDTAEREEDSPNASFRAILDKQGRIMVAMTFNTDMGDSWEREGEDPDFFQRFSPPGYAMGVDVMLYALTH
jgi:hypothetical protein